MPLQHRESAEAWAQLDDAFFRLLAAIRSGEVERGRRFGEADLVQLLGVPAVRVRPAAEQLQAIGLFRAADRGTVVVATPTIDDWADSVRFLIGLSEMTIRLSVPTLDEADVDAFVTLATRAQQQAALRDIGFTETLLNVHRFFAERAPSPLLVGAVRTTIRRLAYMLTPTPPYRQWAMNDFFSLMVEAVTTRDADLGTEAAHVLIRHAERHIGDTRAEWTSMDS